VSALVTLHGFTGHASDWAKVAPGHHLTIAGHAADVAVPAGHDFLAEVDRLADAIAALAEPVHLCGYSLGARLALHLGLRHPHLIARLTLVGVHPGLVDPYARAARHAADEAWADLLERRGIAAFVAAWEREALWASQARLPAPILATQRQRRLAHDPMALAASLRVLGLAAMPSAWDRLTELECPVTLVVGADDDKFRRFAAAAAARLPRATVHAVPGAGHNLVLEAPLALSRLLPTSHPGPASHPKRSPRLEHHHD
jgi:2-succinyl-6-hydroxy-2,4-cyclohexadiene-1-carboxylate synthase